MNTLLSQAKSLAECNRDIMGTAPLESGFACGYPLFLGGRNWGRLAPQILPR